MAVLPRVEGGYLVPTLAYADADDDANEKDTSFTFTVVGLDQVGIQVCDVAHNDEAGNFLPVDQAEVTLTAVVCPDTAATQTVSGTTGNDGKVILSLADLRDQDKNGKVIDERYQCRVTVTIKTTSTAPVKMRDFYAGTMFMSGANGYVFGMHADTGGVYLERFTFDDCDIQYNKPLFMRAKENNAQHTFTAWVGGITDNARVTLKGYKKDSSKPDGKGEELLSEMSASTKYSDGHHEALFSGNFLQVGDAKCLDADEVVLEAGLPDYGLTTYIEMDTQVPPVGSIVYPDHLNPLPAASEDLLSITAQGDWPCFNGFKLGILNPGFPITVRATFDHIDNSDNLVFYVLIGLNLGQVLFGPNGQGAYQCFPWGYDCRGEYQHYRDEHDNRVNQLYAMLNSRAQPYLTRDSISDTMSEKCIKLSYILQLIGNLQWSKSSEGGSAEGKKIFEGGLTAYAGFSVMGSFTYQAVVSNIPVYVTFSTSFDATYGFTLDAVQEMLNIEEQLNLSKMITRYENAHSINLSLSFAGGIGVGMSGLASVGVNASITLAVTWTWGENNPDNKPEPRRMMGYEFNLELALQFCLFKFSVHIWGTEGQTDTWQTKSLTASSYERFAENSLFAFRHPGEEQRRHSLILGRNGEVLLGPYDLNDVLVPVTQDMLDKSKEVKASIHQAGNDELRPQDELGRPTLYAGKAPCVTVLDDGSIGVSLEDSSSTNTFKFGDPLQAGEQVVGSVVEDLPLQDESVGELDGATDQMSGDQYFGFGDPAPIEYEYDYDIYSKRVVDTVCPKGGVNGLGIHGGVKPSVDIPLYKDIFSDSRHKIADINGESYLFRIMGVEYPAGDSVVIRTRIMVTKFIVTEAGYTLGESKVLEYGSGNAHLHRVQMYDYDFDLVTRPSDAIWASNAEACIVVYSGTRPSDGVYDMLANNAISVLFIDKNLNVVLSSTTSAQALAGGVGSAGNRYCLYPPHIVDCFAPLAVSGALGIVVPMRGPLDQSDPMESGNAMFALGYCFVYDDHASMSFMPNPLSMGRKGSVINVSLVTGDDAGNDGVMRMLFSFENGYQAWYARIEDGKSFDNVEVAKKFESAQKLPTIQPWPGHGSFLFAKEQSESSSTNDYHLYAGSFPADGSAPASALTETHVDLNGFRGASFCVSPSGEHLFYYESRRAAAEAAEGISANDDTEQVSLYRIMASHLIDGKFCEGYPFAEMDHPILRFELMTSNHQEACVFLTLMPSYTEDDEGNRTYSLDDSTANLHYMAVPYSMAAKANALSPMDPFVCAGKPCLFQLDVTNHGNVVIGGFTTQMYDAAGSGSDPVATAEIKVTSANDILLTASCHNWADATPQESDNNAQASHLRLTDHEKQGWLLPGKTLSFRVSYQIPESWSGEKKVIIKIVDARVPDVNLAAQEEGHVAEAKFLPAAVLDSPDLLVKHFHEEGATGVIQMSSHDLAWATLYDPEERTGEVPGGGAVPSPVRGSVSRQKTKKRGDTLPQMGDSLSAGPLGLALTGAAAALVGYSARRTQIEQESEES